MESVKGWFREFGILILILFAVQVAAYNFLYTNFLFTNHTFPNAWVLPSPSYITTQDGRWLSDLIILLQGGGGNSAFQMTLATVLQAINGILLATFIGLKRKGEILLVSALLCLYPAFLDYYSFTNNHIAFVLADTFVVLAMHHFVARGNSPWRSIRTSFLLFLAISIYQPRIALVGFLGAVALLVRNVDATDDQPQEVHYRTFLKDLLSLMMIGAMAMVGYWLLAQLLIGEKAGFRTYLNTPAEAALQIFRSYWEFFTLFAEGVPGLPRGLDILPLTSVVLGVGAVLWRAWKQDRRLFAWGVVIVASMPLLLYAPYVVNKYAWPNAGRILSATGYCLAVFVAWGMRSRWTHFISLGLASVLLYFFFILATQESNAALMKNAYDMNMINRIAVDIGHIVGRGEKEPRPLVIAGSYLPFERSKYLASPEGRINSQLNTYAFAPYRQVEIVNFFLGGTAVRHPTEQEQQAAFLTTKDKPVWPSPGSVYLVDDTVVVLLESYRFDLPLTQAR